MLCTLSSQIDLKRSILSPKGEDENIMQELNSKQNNDHIEIQEFQKQKNSSNSNINSLRTDIEKELSRQKEETIDTIESAKAEIYENLDEILQNHVNALQEEKLLLLEEDHGELSSPKSGTGLDNNFSEDSKPPLAHMESHSTSRAGRDNH